MKLPQIIKLENGLTIVLLEKPDTYSVSFCAAVRAGSKYETAGNVGAAHFFEHMLFEGTEKYSDSKKLGWFLEKAGGRNSAWTDKDYVQYTVKLPKDQWEIGLEYLSQILFHPRFSSEMVENEKKIITEEYKRKTDNSEIEAWELFMINAFDQNTYLGRSILGTLPAINSLTVSKLEEYLRLQYVPENIVLCIVGNFASNEVLSVLKNYFENKNVKAQKIIENNKIDTAKKKVFFEPSSDLQTQIVLGFITDVTLSHRDLPILKLIRNLLGFGLGSRIVQELVYKKGIAYSTAAWNTSYQDIGLFNISCGVSPKNVTIAIESILHEFTKLKTIKITKSELKGAVIQELAEEYYSYENNESVSSTLALQQLLEDKIKSIKDKQNELETISQDDITNIARKYFTAHTLKCLIRGNTSSDQKKKVKEAIGNFK